MEQPNTLPDSATVIGLGKTGLSCARYLCAQGVKVSLNDTREQPPGLERLHAELPDVDVRLGGLDMDLIQASEMLVVSPGVSLDTPEIAMAKAYGVPVIGDIELFAREARAPIVAITGSNGKSSVTTLVGQMAEAAGRKVAVGGNLGAPALQLLDDEVELYVLEISSFQLESTESLAPEVAVVLNLSADHLDRHGDMATYAALKAKIYLKARQGVINRDDKIAAAMAKRRAKWSFGLDAPNPEDKQSFGIVDHQGQRWIAKGAEPVLPAVDLKIPGRHNQANVMAALALGGAVRLPLQTMLRAAREFGGLPHRTELVAEIDGVRWFNDSKATNIGACIAALKGLDDNGDGRTILIAGGDAKGASFEELAPVLAKHAKALVLIGRDAPLIAEAVGDALPVVQAEVMESAVKEAAKLADAGDRVLLSPACASFDQYRNYEERGEAFMMAVWGQQL